MKQLFTAAENLVDLNDAQVTGAWLADRYDVEIGRHPYATGCAVGDWLVALRGYDRGSVGWVENFGEPPHLVVVPRV